MKSEHTSDARVLAGGTLASGSFDDQLANDGGLTAGQILRRDHEQLEGVYAKLLAAYQSGEWEAVRVQWDTFDSALRAHMEKEETAVFPAFRAVDATTAVELAAEHDELRKSLGAFGVRVDLHSFVLTDAEALIDRVRAHAARENAVLYPWVDLRW